MSYRRFGRFGDSDPSEWTDPYAQTTPDASNTFTSPPLQDVDGNTLLPDGTVIPPGVPVSQPGAPVQATTAGTSGGWVGIFQSLFANPVQQQVPVQLTTASPTDVVSSNPGSFLLVAAGSFFLGWVLGKS